MARRKVVPHRGNFIIFSVGFSHNVYYHNMLLLFIAKTVLSYLFRIIISTGIVDQPLILCVDLAYESLNYRSPKHVACCGSLVQTWEAFSKQGYDLA